MEPKLQWPTSRTSWVPRARLIEDLDRASRHPVALVAAPAGYGKTTLLAQWLTRAEAPIAAWVTLDAGDNDPGRLWTHVAAALERAGCPLSTGPGGSFRPVNGSDVMTTALPRMFDALSSLPHDIVIALDDFHCIQEPACHAQVQFLIENLPSQAHLMIITRADPGLRLGRLRASGLVAEIRAEHLSFTVDETCALLANEDVHLSGDSLSRLVSRTEGWPAGLYLATFSLAGRTDPDDFVNRFSGGNRFLGDYLTEEVLSRLTDEVRDFITTMSILDRFTVGLCDHVAEAPRPPPGSCETSNAPTCSWCPLGPDGVWFRFHHLFAAVARSELEMTRPDRVPLLHARAARWFRDHGHIDEAIRHSLAAGNTGDAALLAQENWLTYLDAGRGATVSSWLEALGPPAVATDPAAGVTAAWMAGLRGDPVAWAGHVRSLEELRDHGPLPDGARSVESAISAMDGLFGYAGAEAMAAGARRALELETDARSPYFAVAHFAAGHLAYVEGDLDVAAATLAQASLHETAPAVIRVMSLGTESLVEAERGAHRRSRELAELAMEVVDAHGLRADPPVLDGVHALGGAQAADGETAAAMVTLEEGLALRRLNPVLGPWATIHHFLVMARVAVDAGQRDLADQLTRRGRDAPGHLRLRDAGDARPARRRAGPGPGRATRGRARGAAHGPGAGRAQAPAGPAQPRRDRPRAAPVVQHRQDAHAGRLPEAGCPLAPGGRRDRPAHRRDLTGSGVGGASAPSGGAGGR